VLAFASLVLAWRPRAAAPALYAVVIGSFVISLLGSLVSSTRWLERLSVFHYMALAPARPVDAVATATLCAVALVLFVLATTRFGHRDLAAS
jgi:putative exporter of polyketide antibiotics